MNSGDIGSVVALFLMVILFLPALFLLGSDKNDGMKTPFCILGPLALIPYALIVLLRLLTGLPLMGKGE